MRQKILATGAALVLASLAAVGTFASQDGVTFLEDPTVEPTATETAEATATSTPEPTETSEPTASPTETGDATATPAATETPDGDDDDIHGIPADNPNHVDDDGDGICEKGEAAVKTTPSGNQVRVPCHAADKSDHEEKNNHKDSGDDADDSEADEADDDDAEAD